MSRAWATWNLSAEGRTLYAVPNFDSWEALQYLYGVWSTHDFDLETSYRYMTMLESIEYVGQCLDDGHFDERFFDECIYLDLTVDAWEPGPARGDGRVEIWVSVKEKLRQRLYEEAMAPASF